MRGTLVENPYGRLLIWEHPQVGRSYAIAADASSGVKKSVKEGDPSACCVLDMWDCRQVAEWHGYMNPTLFGLVCSRIGLYYNSGPLAFETAPSMHGLAAYNAAERYNYPTLWTQTSNDRRDPGFQPRKGWIRSPHSTMHLMNRVREAMLAKCVIRSGGLLDELAAMRLEEGRPKSEEHDDRIIAYAIALTVRDQAFFSGEIIKPAPPIEDLADLDWREEEELARTGGEPDLGDPLHDFWNRL